MYTFLDLPISTGNYDKNDHVSYIKQIARVLATIYKRSHVDKVNGALAGPRANRTVIKKTLYLPINTRVLTGRPKGEWVVKR